MKQNEEPRTNGSVLMLHKQQISQQNEA